MGGIYYKVSGQIQVLGPYFHHDIVDILNNGCELFREAPGVQLGRIKDAQENMYQGMRNLANDVYTRLIRNDQRNATKEGVANGLFSPMGNLAVKMKKNYQGNQQINQKVTAAENKWKELVRP